MTWLMALCLSCIMSSAISCFNLLLNKGLVDGFFSIWMYAWWLSWLMAFRLILGVLPLARNTLLKFSDVPK